MRRSFRPLAWTRVRALTDRAAVSHLRRAPYEGSESAGIYCLRVARPLLLSVLLAGLCTGCGGHAAPHRAAPAAPAPAASATATATTQAPPRLRLVATHPLPDPVQLPA